jgi:hypothetical protein
MHAGLFKASGSRREIFATVRFSQTSRNFLAHELKLVYGSFKIDRICFSSGRVWSFTNYLEDNSIKMDS